MDIDCNYNNASQLDGINVVYNHRGIVPFGYGKTEYIISGNIITATTYYSDGEIYSYNEYTNIKTLLQEAIGIKPLGDIMC